MMLKSSAKRLKAALLLVTPLWLAACAAPPLSVPFRPEAAKFILDKGPNVISGQASFVSKSGYLRYCEEAKLFPVTTYSKEWMSRVFTEADGFGTRVAADHMPYNEGFETYSRTVDCDEQGRFRFNGVVDGDYYVYVPINWLLRWQHNGGVLMKKVVVSGGRKISVILLKNMSLPTGNSPQG